MTDLRQRLPVLLEERLELLPLLRANADNLERDMNGSASASVANALRFVGVATYVLYGDVQAFREHLAGSGSLRLRLFERFENGEGISKSYVSMLAYKSLFNALAAADFDLATALAKRIGGRHAIEEEYDHPFDCALGYTLKAFVLGDKSQMHGCADRLSDAVGDKMNRSFSGYGDMFRAILDADTTKANAALLSLVKGHQNESKGRGVFKDTEDEVLCVWGVGMANLALHSGMPVNSVAPLIPTDLLL